MKHSFVITVLTLLSCSQAAVGQPLEKVQPEAAGSKRIVVQNYYYAKPGKADEVFQWRLHASDVREKLGLPRGRVLRHVGEPERDKPDVVWECEYPDEAAREEDVRILSSKREFDDVMKHMGTLIQRFERAIYEVEEPRTAGNR